MAWQAWRVVMWLNGARTVESRLGMAVWARLGRARSGVAGLVPARQAGQGEACTGMFRRCEAGQARLVPVCLGNHGRGWVSLGSAGEAVYVLVRFVVASCGMAGRGTAGSAN